MQAAQGTIRVLICNRHAIFRDGVRLLIQNCGSIEVVGETSTAREAVDKLAKLKPDVVLLDMTMPDLSGFEATRRIKNIDPRVTVLILSLHDDEALVSRCMEAGADGYIHKDTSALFLESAIRAVYRKHKRAPATVATTAPSVSEVEVDVSQRMRLHRAS